MESLRTENPVRRRVASTSVSKTFVPVVRRTRSPFQGLRAPRPATGVSRARSVPGVSPRVSPKTGCVRESVRQGVSGALQAPGSGVSKKFPESVPGVSKRCPGHSGDTLGTLFGHSGAPETPLSDTPSDTPGFRGHPRGHFGARERLL